MTEMKPGMVAFFALLMASACCPPRCTAVKVSGAPTQTVAYAEVTWRSWWAYYTHDGWPWPFQARELSRPHAVITGFSDRRLRKGETIILDRQPGVMKDGTPIWTVERRKR